MKTNFESLSDKEQWKDIKGYKGHYQISNKGRVKSLKFKKHRILKQTLGCRGRMQVHLYLNRSKGFTQKVHRLVLSAFIGPCPKGCEGSHLNGKSNDNNVSNLRWETPKENMARQAEHGTNNIGSRNGRSKLTEEQVVEIKGHLFRGIYQKTIANQYEVCIETISAIGRGKIWNHVK